MGRIGVFQGCSIYHQAITVRRRREMLPLTFAQQGETVIVVKLSGNDAAKKHLADLGFVEGTEVNVVSSHNGDLILNVKGTKLAMTREMATKVKVTKAEE